ncbi:alkene reductase [Bacillus sp. NP157]|nr:alkene reductase [Bacillus sp. NP157]
MSNLFKEFRLGDMVLRNRVVMAPMTRARAPGDVPNVNVALYYAQRATAGLIISEGTPISLEGQGYIFNPGIYTAAQIAGWKLVTDSVHAVGGRMFAQIWHVGRISHPSIQGEGTQPLSSSTRRARGGMAYGFNEQGEPALVGTPAPRRMTEADVDNAVRDFAQAARNAMEAGFDGVEIHGANGYLIEQFLNPLVNDRDDRFGAGNIDDRLRFTLAVIDAVVGAVGRHRVGIRLSPYSVFQDMPLYPAIDETYSALAKEIGARGLAYVHLIDQSQFKVEGFDSGTADTGKSFFELVSVMRPSLTDTAVIVAGGLTKTSAEELIDGGDVDLAAFGANFVSNPDLVERMRNGWPLATPHRDTFYGGGAEGYVDYAPYTPEALPAPNR